jgi:hypothetical protein
VGYENSTFAINSAPLIFKLVHDLKPCSRKKPKLKYETLDDIGSEISILVNIRTQIVIHYDDGKAYGYAVLSQLCPRSWGKSVLIRKPNQPTYYKNYIRLQAYVREICNEVTNLYGEVYVRREIIG